jgi:heat shock protein HtpX
MLPGSRTPVPSVLRTHPKTEERVARLMAFKHGDAPADLAADGPAMPPPRQRPSLVPGIRARRPDIAAFMPFHAMDMPVAPDASACPHGLASADGDPRIRPMRGGVYF